MIQFAKENRHQPNRMCIVCRGRFAQGDLARVQYINGELVKFTKVGRSFYVCKDCIDSKQLTKKLSSFLKIPKTEVETNCAKLKEIVFDGRQ